MKATNKKLINCSDCAKEISKNAKTCPNCGAKNKKKSGAAGLIALLLVGLFLMASFNVGSEVNSSAQDRSSAGAEKLEVQNWRCSESYGYITAEGRVKNISNQPLKNIQVVAEHFAKDGTFITSDSALIEYNPIMPGQISPFKAMTTQNPMMSKCSISFKTLMGGAVSFVNK